MKEKNKTEIEKIVWKDSKALELTRVIFITFFFLLSSFFLPNPIKKFTEFSYCHQFYYLFIFFIYKSGEETSL